MKNYGNINRKSLVATFRNNVCFLYSEPEYETEFQHFLRGNEASLQTGTGPKMEGLTSDQVEAMFRLSKLPAFDGLPEFVQSNSVSTTIMHISAYTTFCDYNVSF